MEVDILRFFKELSLNYLLIWGILAGFLYGLLSLLTPFASKPTSLKVFIGIMGVVYLCSSVFASYIIYTKYRELLPIFLG